MLVSAQKMGYTLQICMIHLLEVTLSADLPVQQFQAASIPQSAGVISFGGLVDDITDACCTSA